MRFRIIIIMALFIAPADHLSAQEAIPVKKHPIFLNLQYAGNVGLVSIGAGTVVYRQRIYLGLIYGFLPKSDDRAEVHTIAVKAYYRIFKLDLSPHINTAGYAGTNVNFAFSRNTHLDFPAHFPEDYYHPNAIHLAPFIGQRVDLDLKASVPDKIGLYLEVGSVDKYIAHFTSSRQVSFWELLSLGIGVSLVF